MHCHVIPLNSLAVCLALGLVCAVASVGEAKQVRAGEDHWAFQSLQKPEAPAVGAGGDARNAIDRFILARLEARGLSIGPEADRAALARRVCFDLTGLPPTPAEVDRFVNDTSTDAYEQMVERYLASPRYGERWGQYWLDAAGYADTSGYFSNERDRPLAYRYRDYVIESFNRDVPFDQFVREQLAGDELVDFKPDAESSPGVMRALVATHYLSNAPDGTDQSAAQFEAMRLDRYAALEGTQQVVASSLLGLSLKCARCHDHKYEPITQREYYQVQSILLPALNPADWVPPLKRTVRVATADDIARWTAKVRQHEAELAALREQGRRIADSIAAREMAALDDACSVARSSAPPDEAKTVFADATSDPVAARWVSTAPAGAEDHAVVLDQEIADRHCATRQGTALRVLARNHCESLLATKQKFDWTPDEVGQSIQVTFDLVADQTTAGGSPTTPAGYFGYFASAHESFRRDKTKPGGDVGNVLLDGNSQGNPNVYFDYPGDAARKVPLGTTTYAPARNFGVRVTNAGGGNFHLLHLADGIPDGEPLSVRGVDLPDGAFGFYFGASRSFVVDNVTIRSGKFSGQLTPAHQFIVDQRRRAQIDQEIKRREASRPTLQGTEVAWVSDRSSAAPKVYLLKRGAYGANGDEVQPSGFAVLTDSDNAYELPAPSGNARSTGRRLAFARWLTRPGSRPAALLARVQADRIWRNHFGRGLVPTADNFGLSGTPPTHPELLEFLAASLVESAWRVKSLHRLILNSGTYRQSSLARPTEAAADPDNALYWRFPLRRLDAEAIRDSMLAVSGELDVTAGGPAVPIDRYGSEQEKTRGALNREIVVNERTPGARRRSIFLEHRRTQLPTQLALFGTPSIAVNCIERSAATVPLQSLAQLNSEFVRLRAKAAAERLMRESNDNDGNRVTRAYRLAIGRAPTADELSDARAFLAEQRTTYLPEESPDLSALTDFCQMLFASNPFLYVE